MLRKSFNTFRHSSLQFSYICSFSSLNSLEESIRLATQEKDYRKIPDLLSSSKVSSQNPNPFSFLSKLSNTHRARVVCEILQSFIPIRPRSNLQLSYSFLLSSTLQSPNPLPLCLAILQRTLRSGCVPFPQTHLLLSNAWLDRKTQSESTSKILLEMQSIGYQPDCGTCNYLIVSLSKVDQLKEAIKVIDGMRSAGCIPDSDSYGIVIGAMCKLRMIPGVVEMMKEMVIKSGLYPRQEVLVKVVAAMRANKQPLRAVEMIEFLEREGFYVGFESYGSVIEGCLECGVPVLAGKVVMGMTERGFIPYIRVRQRIVKELTGAGEWDLARAVRHRFAELKS